MKKLLIIAVLLLLLLSGLNIANTPDFAPTTFTDIVVIISIVFGCLIGLGLLFDLLDDYK